MRVLRRLPLLGIPLVTACGILGIGDDGRGIRDHATLVASVQRAGLVRVHASSGEVIARTAVSRDEDGYGNFVPDPALLPRDQGIFGDIAPDGVGLAFYFSASEFHEIWSEPWSRLFDRSEDVTSLNKTLTLASPNGHEFVLFHIVDGVGDRGLGALDPANRTIRSLHDGELVTRWMAVLTPGASRAAGAVVAFASREGNPRTHPAHLWVIDPEEGGILDSIPEAELPPAGDYGLMWGGLDDRHVFFVGGQGLIVYDVWAREVTSTLPLAGTFDGIVVDPWSDRFLLYDAGGPNYPGSGLIQVFDGAFDRTLIDLVDRVGYAPGEAPSIRGAAFGDDGLIYILAGAESAGVSQEIKLVVADPEAGEVLRFHDLDLDGNPVRGLFYVPAGR